MNAEPELYPQEALADDEPRYLRRQRPLEIRRRKFGNKTWAGYRRWLALSVGLAAAGWLAWQGQNFLYSSPRMALASDGIEITGTHYLSRDAIAQVFGTDLGRSILRVPLDARRAELDAIPWVAHASVERALSNRIRVEIAERIPVAFLRDGSNLNLVDANGVILDRPLGGNFAFPVISGFGEKMPLAGRAQRMTLYVQFMKDLDLAHVGAGEQVSEVDLTDAHDVRGTVSGLLDDQAVPVLVHFGDDGFVNKYRLLTENVGSWRASAGPLESVDLRFAGQVVVDPERQASAAATAKAKGWPSIAKQ